MPHLVAAASYEQSRHERTLPLRLDDFSILFSLYPAVFDYFTA
jgi:hypothetical protein